ncbi:site-2 protease family protein [Planctomycetota bacterium]
MTRPNDKSDSATTRRVALTMRPDLSMHRQRFGGEGYWVVKDPVALTYFHLRDEEHAILKMLDGRTSLDEIKRRFEEAFAPLQIGFEQLQAFLGRLYQSGLVLAEASGQGGQLLLRHGRRRRRALVQSASNLLAIRFRGFDPESFLAWLYPKCRWLFSWWFLAGCTLLVLCAGALAVVQFDVLRSKLPDFQTFFTARNLILLAVALAAAKVLHELGHALSCKHFGGECHEIGILLLVFTPCLYCNVSDSWMLSSKWQRIAITAAGILVEVVLASVCTLLWWLSEPGLLNTLCLSMMFVCSVNTLLFNGNPLLRYDGYFILSDLVEVPNLGQQSRALVGRALGRFFLGMESIEDRSLPDGKRGFLATYGVAATVYRWFVVIGILWFCYQFLKPYGLELVAQGFSLFVIAGLFIAPVGNLAVLFRNPRWRRRIDRPRALVTCGLMAAALAAVSLIPLPFRVRALVVLEPEGAQHVYVVVPGTLAASVSAGESVRAGEELGRLENLDLRREIAELVGDFNQQRLELENLELRLAGDPSVAPRIPAAREALADVEERLRQRRRDESRLVLRAPADGTVLPPPRRPAPHYLPGHLHAWQGSPLDEKNVGSHLETGAFFCLVGDPTRLEGSLVLDQADMKFVRMGQRVRMQFDEVPGRVIKGTVAEIAKTDVKVAPRELAAGRELPVRVDEQGIPRPVETSYHARVVLDEYDENLLTGTRGRAKILGDSQSLGRRLYRYLGRTFNFSL